MKSKQSKLYNPEVDKIKIIEGDPFDVNGRIGLRTSQASPPKVVKSEHEIVNYSYPLKLLQNTRYDKTKNLVLEWNPFVI
jgi:hypothetical protein